jgi:hypothetical protein
MTTELINECFTTSNVGDRVPAGNSCNGSERLCDAVTRFFQTIINSKTMRIARGKISPNPTVKLYPSGRMMVRLCRSRCALRTATG